MRRVYGNRCEHVPLYVSKDICRKGAKILQHLEKGLKIEEILVTVNAVKAIRAHCMCTLVCILYMIHSCSSNCVNPSFKCRFYLFIRTGFIEFLVSLMPSVYLIITLLH